MKSSVYLCLSLLCLALTVRQWQKLLRWRMDMAMINEENTIAWTPLLDLVVTTPLLALSAELGVAPHCRYPERWPFYGGIGVYMGFAVAVHRLRQRCRELLREELAQTVANPSDAEAEFRSLFG